MRPQRSQGKIRPKVSSMPRQNSEAAAYLDIYKLAIEKERLLNELNGLEQRSKHIRERLAILSTQVHSIESPAQAVAPIAKPPATKGYNTLFFEY
ncbi:MAG: gas vesicle protein [Anaerolineae bacterium]|nr:gas vesicle protein [Gloeobacterales cyanobacterium ES-bin-313]